MADFQETLTQLDEAQTRKDFRAVAALLKEIPDKGKRAELAAHHAEIFSKSNPRFDRSRFMSAAGVDRPLKDTSVREDVEDAVIENPPEPPVTDEPGPIVEPETFNFASAMIDSVLDQTPVTAKDAFAQAMLDRTYNLVNAAREDMARTAFQPEPEFEAEPPIEEPPVEQAE